MTGLLLEKALVLTRQIAQRPDTTGKEASKTAILPNSKKTSRQLTPTFWREQKPHLQTRAQQNEFRNKTVTTMNQSLEFDIKPAAGASALRPRAGGHGRHHGKMPDMFPDVLADVALSKNVALEAASALVPSEKSATRDDEVDTGDKKQDSPPEEKILQPAIPVDMKQYLQIIAAVAQKQTGGGEPAPSQVFATASLASGVTRIETQPALPKLKPKRLSLELKPKRPIPDLKFKRPLPELKLKRLSS